MFGVALDRVMKQSMPGHGSTGTTFIDRINHRFSQVGLTDRSCISAAVVDRGSFTLVMLVAERGSFTLVMLVVERGSFTLVM